MTHLEKIQLACKVGLFGLNDLRKLAPIGNLGYENEWYPPFWGNTHMFYDVESKLIIFCLFIFTNKIYWMNTLIALPVL